MQADKLETTTTTRQQGAIKINRQTNWQKETGKGAQAEWDEKNKAADRANMEISRYTRLNVS